jgi:hypothetical protein
MAQNWKHLNIFVSGLQMVAHLVFRLSDNWTDYKMVVWSLAELFYTEKNMVIIKWSSLKVGLLDDQL